MSLNDRDYLREETRRTSSSGLPIAMIVIIALNVLLFVADNAVGHSLFGSIMPLTGETLTSPSQWYRFLTAGFAHDPSGIYHLLGNMLVLFFFAPPVERKYGSLEFTLFYLVSIIVPNIIWCAFHYGVSYHCLGASGAVTAVLILFALNYPKATLYFMGFVPMPAWVAGLIYIGYDAFFAAAAVDNVAHDVHLAGAGVALLYYFLKIQFSRFIRLPRRASSRPVSLSQIMQSHRKDAADRLQEKVDAILDKINEHGVESLTDAERATLTYASQEYQKRK